ncbi:MULTISPECIES: PA0061/PA0062 family lipoprotein [Pseudomonas syringae group]|uniref:Lipoprotein n=5 Tax=Pseudomonas TaxID=286 RepID=A0AAD0DWL6_9PSED|nr:hypothetical protein BKM03_00335 [Pseudomonas avellanae]POP86059.1 hypothetical protein CXB34_14560 [Pseudomonas amygdali pv. morsprunorum]RML55769.1 Lipoprotein [Pseudomonas amygdali pv. morsprunorum]SOS31427.1 lipoprotein [Pseudomonas syringae group genomosp. 3]SPF10235.1 lipoprotein [Pseudomonas syringae group genomosp. 3]
MRLITLITALTLAGCAGPLPAVDPGMAWIDMRTLTGQLIMADKLDGKNTYDGRYFQVTPGSHELQVRYDYEYRSGGMGMIGDEYTEITCYVSVRYEHFAAGQRYMLEVRSLANSVDAWLYDEKRNVVADEEQEGGVHCI